MKIEQLIVQHIYKSKVVTLQGIGTIHLNPSVVIPTGNEKDFVMPENAFSFDYNLKAPEDTALIDFIVQQTRKIKPLATSDMESYSMLAKQFLNIGKPLVIAGIGTIQKNQEGSYEFIQGQYVSPRIEESPKQITEKSEEPVSFEHARITNHSRTYLGIALGILVLGLVGAALYYFFMRTKPVGAEPATEQVAENVPVTDSLKPDTTATVKIDSLAAKDSLVMASLPLDTNGFKIVVKEYKTEPAATKALSRLSKYNSKFMVIQRDSSTFQLALPFAKPLADTGRIRDSLRIFFGGKPYVLLQ